MNKIIIVLILIFGVLLFSLWFFYFRGSRPSSQTQTSPTPAPAPTPSFKLAEPVKDFKKRVTKKPFGIYITPTNSPIQPERFTGYHTGADAEYKDVIDDVPVFAILDGVVAYSNRVSGYGGVLILKVNIENKPHSVLYGHLRPSTLPKIGKEFKKGDQMAVLGTGYTHETDGERKHLHLAILSNDRIDLRGYVESKNDLSGWIDPLSLY